MARLINLDDAVDAMKKSICGDTYEVDKAIEAIESIPTVEAIPIEWLYAMAEKKEEEKDIKLSLMIKGVVALWHGEQEKQNDNN